LWFLLENSLLIVVYVNRLLALMTIAFVYMCVCFYFYRFFFQIFHYPSHTIAKFFFSRAAESEILSQRDAPQGSGQEWDRISKLCDFNPKANKNAKDVSRMRSLLLQLKQQPLVRSHN
jgi:hypothetical protein